MILFVFLFFLGLALIPVFISVGAIILALGAGGYVGIALLECSFKASKVFGVIMIPFAFAIFGIVTSISLGVSFAAASIALLPVYFIHTFLFFRSIYWWCKPRVKKDRAVAGNSRLEKQKQT